MIRSSDVIASDLHDQTWWLILQEHQQATCPHPINIDGMHRRLDELEKTVKEMRQSISRLEVHHDTTTA